MRDPRGFTLMEVTIVVVLAGVVTLGLLGFYLNSQATWIDASAQAMAQRDATTLLETMRPKIRSAAHVEIIPNSPDNLNHLVILYEDPQGLIEQDRFFWDPGDSLVHHGSGPGGTDQGPIIPTVVERFSVSRHPTLPIVQIDSLRVRSANGQRVRMSAGFALYNGAP